jgi:hypothetical protein
VSGTETTELVVDGVDEPPPQAVSSMALASAMPREKCKRKDMGILIKNGIPRTGQ